MIDNITSILFIIWIMLIQLILLILYLEDILLGVKKWIEKRRK